MMATNTSSHEHQVLAATHDAATLNFNRHGIIEIAGNDALDLLHRLSTNDLVHLRDCECRNTVLTTDKGRIVDHVYLVKVPSKLLMLTSLGREESVMDWIGKYTIMEDIQFNIGTSATVQISIIGPNSLAYTNSALNLALLPWSCTECTLSDGRTAVVFCTKEFGTTSVHIIAQENRPISIPGLAEVVEMSRDSHETFRIMHGIPLTRHELREEFNPFETGLANAISFTKGCYIGQEVIARLDTYQKIQKRLVGITLLSIPERSMIALTYSGNEAGWITSVAPHDLHGLRFGLGIVRNEVAIGQMVTYENQAQVHSATVTELPIPISAGIL